LVTPAVGNVFTILVFVSFFVLDLRARTGETDRQTDGRTGKTRNAVCIGRPHNNSSCLVAGFCGLADIMQQVRSNYAYWKQQEVVVETQKLADDRQQQQPDDDDTS